MARTTAAKAAAPSSGDQGKAGAKAKPGAAAKTAAEDKKASTDGAPTGAPSAGSLASGDQKDSTAASGLPGGDGSNSADSNTATGPVSGEGAAPGTAPGEGGQSLDTSLDTGEGAAPGDASGDGNQSLATGLDTATDPDNSLESGSGDAAGKSADLELLGQANISAVQGETWTLPVLAEFPAVLTLTNAWPGQRHIVGTDETLAPGETRAIEFTEKAYTKFSRHIHQHASLHAWKHGEGLLIEQGAENGEG